uniref:Uncharacterized protein n=1 Tax=Rhizophora mucronata TaxID=61149 RepID=A0A2P2Q5S2_RHIMU
MNTLRQIMRDSKFVSSKSGKKTKTSNLANRHKLDNML